MTESAVSQDDEFPVEFVGFSAESAAFILMFREQYVCALLRSGKLQGKKLGGIWIVPVDKLRDYISDRGGELAAQRLERLEIFVKRDRLHREPVRQQTREYLQGVEPHQLFSVADLSEILLTSHQAVYRLLDSGMLESVRRHRGRKVSSRAVRALLALIEKRLEAMEEERKKKLHGPGDWSQL